MAEKILVTYGSKRGSTAEIAERIGETLRTKGLQADVRDAGVATGLAPYDAVILGSSVYMGLWHKHAVKFLKNNRDGLAKLPVWLFISGPTGPGNPVDLVDGWYYPKSLQPVIDTIRPRDITCFGGKLDKSKLNPFEKWIMNNVKAVEGDYRNWEDIDSWAEKISAENGMGVARCIPTFS